MCFNKNYTNNSCKLCILQVAFRTILRKSSLLRDNKCPFFFFPISAVTSKPVGKFSFKSQISCVENNLQGILAYFSCLHFQLCKYTIQRTGENNTFVSLYVCLCLFLQGLPQDKPVSSSSISYCQYTLVSDEQKNILIIE